MRCRRARWRVSRVSDPSPTKNPPCGNSSFWVQCWSPCIGATGPEFCVIKKVGPFPGRRQVFTKTQKLSVGKTHSRWKYNASVRVLSVWRSPHHVSTHVGSSPYDVFCSCFRHVLSTIVIRLYLGTVSKSKWGFSLTWFSRDPSPPQVRKTLTLNLETRKQVKMKLSDLPTWHAHFYDI